MQDPINEILPAQLAMATVPSTVITIVERLMAAGHECYCVGGCVRDLLMGREVGDWDLTTSAQPQEVVSLFDRVVETGLQHGTVTVCEGGSAFEVTTYRIDVGASDGRRPDEVRFTRSLTEDLKRRDFTMNALAWCPPTGHFVDLFDGQSDIDSKVIRAVGDASLRLHEDGLRGLRALRFMSTLGFRCTGSLRAAIQETRHVFEKVSVERIWQEMQKLLLGGDVEASLMTLMDCGLLPSFWPVFEQPRVEGLSDMPPRIEIRLAYLFSENPEAFDGSASRLKLPKKLVKRVSHLVSQ